MNNESKKPPTAGAMRCGRVRSLLAAALLLLIGPGAPGQEPANPLKPPDRSSPRAALRTFFAAGDAVGTFLERDYLPSSTRAEFQQLIELGDAAMESLNLDGLAAATRTKTGRSAALALYETLSRIPLPPEREIPDTASLTRGADTNLVRWVVPDTEIVLERVTSGPRGGEFLFSTATVERANDFYQIVRDRAYVRAVPLPHLKQIVMTGGGWMVPYRWITSLPPWMRIPLAGQAAWKWFALVVVLCGVGIFLRLAWRLSRRGDRSQPFRRALAEAALPAGFLIAAPLFAYITLVQLNLLGSLGTLVAMGATAVMFLAGAWICWRLASVVAEAIIASPRISPESIDAHLIRICARLFGILAGAGLLAMGADRLGLPVYGIIAGLGVGGLAIALAAQPTIENLIGGLSLFADKSLRVGDICRCGTDEGTVEAIGIRSTWIRGADRSLTTIPNAALSKMPVVNLGRRDEMLIQTVIGVRYETSPEQLRCLLGRLREMLLAHPSLHTEKVRARLIGLGASSIDIELFALVNTLDRLKFLGIREDVLLRVMEIVEECGSSFAFPSQTVYLGRDRGLDPDRTAAAEAQVRRWRSEGRLPFPDLAPEHVASIRDSLAYPPPGSPGASPGAPPHDPRAAAGTPQQGDATAPRGGHQDA